MEALPITYIKKAISIFLITFGLCGLLFALPDALNGFKSPISASKVFFVLGLCFLISGIFIAKINDKETRHLHFQIPKTKVWKISFSLLLISLTTFIVPLIINNPVPGYAPYTFAYHIGFLIPVYLISFVSSFIGLLFGLMVLQSKDLKVIYRFVPLLPLILITIFLGSRLLIVM